MSGIINGAQGLIAKMQLNLLSGGSNMQSIAQGMGISSNNGDTIGQSVVPHIASALQWVGIIAAVVGIGVAAIRIILARKQESRVDAISAIGWAVLGVIILGSLLFIVGFVIHLATN